LEERDKIIQQVKANLEKAQVYMKNQADKKRRDVELQVGDWVLVRLQPYIQQSVALRKNQKLGMRLFGPFMIIAKVGMVAYKLQLPEEAKIHSVFHVSQLMLFKGGATEQYLPLPLTMTEQGPVVLPSKVLDVRIIQQGQAKIPQVLIQWTNIPAQDATWENVQDIKVNFPKFNLEDKVLLKGDGIVMRQMKEKGVRDVESPNEEWRAPSRKNEGNSDPVYQETRKSTRTHKPNTTLKDFITT
jgi:hypothetical protein